MGAGAVLEPLLVIVLLFGGTWINRITNTAFSHTYIRRQSSEYVRADSRDSLESECSSPTSKDGLLSTRSCSPIPQISDDRWHKRQLTILGLSWTISSHNTEVFKDRLLSRLLRKLPFLVECWYWALVYWVSRHWLREEKKISSSVPLFDSRVIQTDISARSCIHRRHPSRRHRQRRQKPCPEID